MKKEQSPAEQWVGTMKYNGRRIGFTRKRTHNIYYSGVNTFHQTLIRARGFLSVGIRFSRIVVV